MTVYTKSYVLPDINHREVARYAGVKIQNSGEIPQELNEMLSECIALCEDIFTPRVCGCETEIKLDGDTVDLGFCTVRSAQLSKNLCGCERAVIFAATVGHEIDRLIAKQGVLSPARAVIMNAIGAERIEALCDAFNDEIKREKAATGLACAPRFSPGYGDLPLEFQKDIFALLDCPRRIGLTLNESLLMSPSKSVTAIIGIRSKNEH